MLPLVIIIPHVFAVAISNFCLSRNTCSWHVRRKASICTARPYLSSVSAASITFTYPH